MNKCKVCGRETKNKKYCSNKCKYIDKTYDKKLCLNCGKPVDRCEVLYCCRKCYFEHKKKLFEENIKYNNCIICGKPTKNKKYCSMKCLGKDESRKAMSIKNLPNDTNWTDDEISLLKSEYGVMPIQKLAKMLNRSSNTIIRYANQHNITSKRLWTNEEIQFLLNHTDNIDLLVEKLGKSKSAIINKLSVLNGFRDETGYSIVSPQEYITKYICDELGYGCVSEMRVEKYTLDLVLYNLDFEIQGSYWHYDSRIMDEEITEKQKVTIEKDERRKEYLESKGYIVVYLWEYDIVSNPSKIKKYIKELISNLIKSLSENEKEYWITNCINGIENSIKKEEEKNIRANKRLEHLKHNLKIINKNRVEPN